MTKRIRTRPLPLEEAILRPLKSVRLAASTSFTADEVLLLDTMFSAMRRGSDVRTLYRSPVLSGIERKVLTMKATIERQRERRAAKAGVKPLVTRLVPTDDG